MKRQDMVEQITEKTTLPIYIVGTLVVCTIGAMIWLTEVHYTGRASAKMIREVKVSVEDFKTTSARMQKEDREKIYSELRKISDRLSKIEGKLERVNF